MKYATEEAFVGANAFGKGAANTAYAQYFVGNSYLNPLTEPQLIAHAKGNINMGNDAAFLTKVVLQCLPYIGYPRSLNAMDCIAKAAKQ